MDLETGFKFLVLVPGVGPSFNDWYKTLHWAVRKKTVDFWHDEVQNAILEQKVGKLSFPVILLFRLEIKKGVIVRDSSNCSITVKLMEDGLVKAGILKGDDPRFVRAIIMFACRSVDEESRTRIMYKAYGN